MMNRRGRKPIIAIKMQIDLFKKYHEQLQETNIKCNHPIFTTMSKEINRMMSPKALFMSYKRNYANNAFLKPRTSEDTVFVSRPSTNTSTPIADKRWQNWKSVVKAKCQKIRATNPAVKTNTLNDTVARPCGRTPLFELKEKLLKHSDIQIVEVKNSNNTEIDEAERTKDNGVSIAQQQIMFSFMKTYKDFGKCQLKGPYVEEIKNILLNQLTEKLNKVGPAIKSPEKWFKYWQDWKTDIKAKWIKINQFNQTEDIMHDYGRVPCPLTPLEEKLVEFIGLDTMENGHEIETVQDKNSIARKHGRHLQMDDVDDSILPSSPEQFEINISGPETSEPGPSKSPETGIIEDVIQAGSAIKMELDCSDSDDPLNFEAEHLSSDSHTSELKSEPEIEQPASPPTNVPRRKRVRRVIRRPITRSRQDIINRSTVNELRKALTQKNEIKKQFYAEYMVEVRKQTEALVAIAKKLTDR